MIMDKVKTFDEALTVLNLASSTATLAELSEEALEFTAMKHKKLRNATEKLLIKNR